MSSTTSSRSSSSSDRMYSPEQLLHLALSRSAQSTTAASATFLQRHAEQFLPVADILVESDSDADFSDSSAVSSSDEEEENENEEGEGVFVYGEGVLRSDLSLELIEQLKEAVHSALDEAFAALDLELDAPFSEPVAPLQVYVSTEPQRQFRHPIVASESSWRSGKTNQQQQHRAHPNVVGAPRRTVPVGLSHFNTAVKNSTTTTTSNSSNPQMDSWRSTLRARRMETYRPSTISKEAATTSWRRTQSVWNEAVGSYVVMKA